MSATTPSKRVWTVEPGLSGFASDEEFFSLMRDVSVIIEKVGGVLSVSSQRQKLEIPGIDGVYGTVRYIVIWQSFAPAMAQERSRPEPVPDPEPEPEPELEPEAAVATA